MNLLKKRQIRITGKWDRILHTKYSLYLRFLKKRTTKSTFEVNIPDVSKGTCCSGACTKSSLRYLKESLEPEVAHQKAQTGLNLQQRNRNRIEQQRSTKSQEKNEEMWVRRDQTDHTIKISSKANTHSGGAGYHRIPYHQTGV